MLRRRVRTSFRFAIAGVAMVPFFALAASSGVSTTTTLHNYEVRGRTASALVRFMNSHAVQGDHGHAYASIHPTYRLVLDTAMVGKMCKPGRVSMTVHFELTLPVANTSQMTRGARSAWNSFSAFAHAHEMHHKSSYLDCAARFVAEAKAQSAPQCFALENRTRQMFAKMKTECEAAQVPFDRSQAKVLARQPLFALARAGR